MNIICLRKGRNQNTDCVFFYLLNELRPLNLVVSNPNLREVRVLIPLNNLTFDIKKIRF